MLKIIQRFCKHSRCHLQGEQGVSGNVIGRADCYPRNICWQLEAERRDAWRPGADTGFRIKRRRARDNIRHDAGKPTPSVPKPIVPARTQDSESSEDEHRKPYDMTPATRRRASRRLSFRRRHNIPKKRRGASLRDTTLAYRLRVSRGR
jgi:hypothetical protein